MNYFIAGISAKWQGTAPVIELKLGIQNPTDHVFNLKSIVGNLYSGNNFIGNVSSYADVTIKGRSQAVVPVDIRISLIGVAIDLYNLLVNGNGREHTISFSGYVNGNGVTVPLEVSYKVI